MTTSLSTALQGHLVDDELQFTTAELCRACSASETEIELWVAEGVLRPVGDSREAWRFGGSALVRTRVATRLARDLEVNSPGVALALELLDEIARLEALLRRGSARPPRP